MPGRIGLAAGGDDGGGQYIEIHDREVVGFSGGDFAFPLGDVGDARAAFEGGHLETTEGAVVRSRARGGAAVVGDEEDEGVLLLAKGTDFSDHAADGVVHAGHHGGEQLAFFVSDFWKALQIFFGSLQRCVLGVERQVEEPRLGFIFLDPVDRTVGIGVGGVEIGIGHGLHFVGNARIDEVGRVEERRVVERAVEFVEAALGGAVFRLVAEVPLADGDRGVAEGFQSRRDRGLIAAEADRVGDGVEFVAEARRIAAGHEAGA